MSMAKRMVVAATGGWFGRLARVFLTLAANPYGLTLMGRDGPFFFSLRLECMGHFHTFGPTSLSFSYPNTYLSVFNMKNIDLIVNYVLFTFIIHIISTCFCFCILLCLHRKHSTLISQNRMVYLKGN
jgi:hypothetical protein